MGAHRREIQRGQAGERVQAPQGAAPQALRSNKEAGKFIRGGVREVREGAGQWRESRGCAGQSDAVVHFIVQRFQALPVLGALEGQAEVRWWCDSPIDGGEEEGVEAHLH